MTKIQLRRSDKDGNFIDSTILPGEPRVKFDGEKVELQIGNKDSESVLVTNSKVGDGLYASEEGNLTAALGVCSHAEGELTKAIGDFSHAEG